MNDIKKKKYKKIVKQSKFWPIVQLFKKRKLFMNEVSQKSQKKILKKLEVIEKNQLGIKTSIAANNKPAPNNKKQQPQADPNKVYDIAIGDSYIMGKEDAPITIIEWTDFQ